MDKIIKRQSAIIGFFGALLVAGAYVAIWQKQWYDSAPMALLILVTPLVLGVLAQLLAKRTLQGAITLKQCVLAYLIVILLFFVTEAVTNYLIFNHIDPSEQDTMRQVTQHAIKNNPNTAASSGVFKQPEFTAAEYLRAVISKTLLYTVLGILTGFFIKNIQTTS